MEMLSQVWITRPWHIWVRHDLKNTTIIIDNISLKAEICYSTTDVS